MKLARCCCISIVLLVAVILLASSVMADTKDAYQGTVRVYIVEPVSRYLDFDNDPYAFGLLDFGMLETVNIADGTVWEHSETWDASVAGFTGITETNIQAHVVVFDDDFVTEDSYPPNNHWFSAYYVDAATTATPDTNGQNQTATGFTHTVFIEEGTGSDCVMCPTSRTVLHGIYESDDYPMLYAAIVGNDAGGDPIEPAHTRLVTDYNIVAYPTLFFDGGYEVKQGSVGDIESAYRTRIESCGARTVPDLDVVIGMEWLGGGDVTVTVRIGNGVPAGGGAPGTPSQPILPGFVLPGACLEAKTTATDPDGHDLYYQFVWTEGDTAEWVGPYASGTEAIAGVCFYESGTYNVKVRARDEWFLMGDWSPVKVVTVNTAPDVPSAPTGPETGDPETNYDFTASTTDLNGDQIYYQFDWDDGTKLSEWYGPYASGADCLQSHSWIDNGSYEVTTHAKDEWDLMSDWSSPAVIQIGSVSCCSIPGDINDNGVGPDIADLVYLVNYMFKQPAPGPPCWDTADVNNNGAGPDIADLVYLVNYMFKQPAPDPLCGHIDPPK